MVSATIFRLILLITPLVALMAFTPAVAAKDLKCIGASYEKRAKRAGKAYFRGHFKKAYGMMLPCAKKGYPEPQFMVGIFLHEDEGQIVQLSDTERDRKALAWIRKAALSGHEEAIYEVVNSYAYGWFGVPENSELEKCWRSAAEDRGQIAVCVDQEMDAGIGTREQRR